ncbi:MAG: hypothetical protein PW788_15535 [Micavibrio sp.]|nr:hypothetical protein [Micavibrio sp.]
MAAPETLMQQLDSLKAAFDAAAESAGRRTFADRLMARDKTTEWKTYYDAAGDVVAAKNFASNGNLPRAAAKLDALEQSFTKAAMAFRAGEQALPEKTYSRKTLFAAAAFRVNKFAARFQDADFQRHKREAKDRVTVLQEAQRRDTLAKKTAAVRQSLS